MSGGGYPDDGDWVWNIDYCEDCGIRLDRHGEECGFERGDPNAPEYGRPAGWLNVGTGEFTPIETEAERAAQLREYRRGAGT